MTAKPPVLFTALLSLGMAATLAPACQHAPALQAAEDARDDVPREFGAVDWRRELEPALADARAADKPVLLLFQEVPG